ncbi:4-hydroxyphenylacetate catabolism regulatory protein HpaA [Marinobacterium weihaiense]|uniref:4-hydroxyphenylacetate catabolism regulatory protein HpaA n=1 Tax=Marinobacterium weihaiense TaxID=2851016 RepID=A0ABS6MEG2_9GAMM|nr:4-hydroxyphenylacetate catabolism regulatory protein HpaA [Marinobacterium weihaiense]MBV0934249.1 4-hydroxyphenylacetate catabolism regulatory protein HpaA [Marinobacterium weihaiense]
MSETRHNEWIPNIILGQDYDRRYLDAPIHYDVLENLAAFYGRDMPVHRHAQYLQIHYIDRGTISFHIDDKVYRTTGPSLIMTPPSVPHSFLTEPEACGHVLTVHQSVAWQLLKDGLQQEMDTELNRGICIVRDELDDEQRLQWPLITQTLRNLKLEWYRERPAKRLTLHTLVRLLLIQISRLSPKQAESTTVNSDDLRVFRRFSDLIEEHYREHLHLPDYTAALGISESRLHQICQRVSNRSPKKLIHDRIVQETKRLLVFTDLSSSDICYQLGFSDPAYFSRFFKRHTGVTAQRFRTDHKRDNWTTT